MFQYLKGSCPVCNGEREDCRQSLDTGLIFCRTNTPSFGFSLRGQDANGFNLYAESNESGTENSARVEQARRNIANRKKEAAAKQLSVSERNAEIKKFIRQLPLADVHSEKLRNRGLSFCQIVDGGYRSINYGDSLSNLSIRFPGLKNGKWIGASGIVCPIRDVLGHYLGFQIRTEFSGAKYVWSKTDDLYTQHLRNGEMPITVARNGNTINLVEGVLKPYVAACRLKGTFIGASGGHFTSSPKQLSATLKILSDEFKTNLVTIYPDAGSYANKNVYRGLMKTVSFIKAEGYEVRIANWGQLKDKSAADADEIVLGTRINFEEIDTEIDEDTYRDRFGFAQNYEDIEELVTDKPKTELRKVETPNLEANEVKYVPFRLPAPNEVMAKTRWVFEPEQRTQFYQEAKAKGWRILLDTSPPGSGKSWTAGNWTPEMFFPDVTDKQTRMFYLTKQSRNPSTATIEENFTELPTRHKGWKLNENKKTPMGFPQRKRAGDNDSDTPGNCRFVDAFTAVADNNRSTSLCKRCPIAKKCQAAVGDGFGFKYQMREALKQSMIRANPLGLSPEMIGKDVAMGIIDEYSQTLEHLKSVVIDGTDLLSGVNEFQEKFPEYGPEFMKAALAMANLISNCNKRYGYTTADIIAAIGKPSDELVALIPAIKEQVEKEEEEFLKEIEGEHNDNYITAYLKKNWLLQFLKAWSGEDASSMRVDGKGLTLTFRNQRLLNMLKQFRFAAYQDATGSKQDLAWRIDVSQDEILECAQARPKKNNLKIVHVRGLGKLSKSRRQTADKRVKSLVAAFKAMYGDSVGFIDWKDKSEKSWLNHFSDARGSNAYEKKTAVASFGAPYTSLSGLQTEYEIYTKGAISIEKDTPSDFQTMISERLAAEVVQEIGRLRATRRQDEDLTYYLCADIDVSFLAHMGFNVQSVDAVNITLDAGTQSQKTLYSVWLAAKELGSNTLTAIANKIGKSKSTVSRAVASVGGWAKLRELMMAIFSEPTKYDIPEAAEPWLETLIPVAIESEDNELFIGTMDDLKAYCEVDLEDMIPYMNHELRAKLFGRLIGLLSDVNRTKFLDFAQTLLLKRKSDYPEIIRC